MTEATNNIRVKSFGSLMTPKEVQTRVSLSEELTAKIQTHRDEIRSIIHGEDKRLLLLIVGPCSIHDTTAGLDYAKKLAKLSHEVKDKILVVMRVYFEKPRTSVGWKGMINDPHLDNSKDIQGGLLKARSFLLEVSRLGMPCATEFLDPIVPQYIADLVSWAAIGARTTESQTHREMASALSMPVGFKNATDGSYDAAVNAMLSAKAAHSFLGIDDDGQTAVVNSSGNKDLHLILRGGKSGPNYSKEHVTSCCEQIRSGGLDNKRPIMVDCSHGNSNKDYTKQGLVFEDVVKQYIDGCLEINGIMLESNLNAGKQNLSENLEYGVSITDGCISWEETEKLVEKAYNLL